MKYFYAYSSKEVTFHASMQLMGKEKPIWRLAFFSRLEERKGIKLFVDAINQLDVSDIPNFEVRA